MPDLPEGRRRPKGDVGLLIVALVAVTAGVACYILKGPEVFFDTLVGDLSLLASILPKVVAGVLLFGLLSVLLPRERVARWMGARSGLRGLLLGSLAGILLPGGQMMAFPLTVALGAAGADIGTAFSFVTAWALLNLNRTLVWEMSFFPHDFVYLRYGVTLLVPLLLGLAARLVYGRRPGVYGKRTASDESGAE